MWGVGSGSGKQTKKADIAAFSGATIECRRRRASGVSGCHRDRGKDRLPKCPSLFGFGLFCAVKIFLSLLLLPAFFLVSRPPPAAQKGESERTIDKRAGKTPSDGQAGQVTPTAAAPLRRPNDDAQLAAWASDELSFLAAYVVNRYCTVNYSKVTS